MAAEYVSGQNSLRLHGATLQMNLVSHPGIRYQSYWLNWKRTMLYTIFGISSSRTALIPLKKFLSYWKAIYRTCCVWLSWFGVEKNKLDENGQHFTYRLFPFHVPACTSPWSCCFWLFCWAERHKKHSISETCALLWTHNISDSLLLMRLTKLGQTLLLLALRYQSMSFWNICHLGLFQTWL